MLMKKQISLSELIRILLDTSNPISAKYLYRLSDLCDEDLNEIKNIWLKIPSWRRQNLLEDTEIMSSKDSLLSFAELSKFALDDPDEHVRALAIRNLWEIEDISIVPKLIEMLATDKSEEVRANAASSLGQYVYLGEIDHLKPNTLHKIEDQLISTYQSHASTLVRSRALEALGYSSRPEVESFLHEAYNSGNQGLLISSLFAMGRSANEDWTPYIEKMLSHQNSEIRREATRAAGELEAKSTLPTLFELVHDEDSEVRRAAIWSLSQIGGSGVRELFLELFNNSEDDEEEDFLEDAIDNLAFTEDVGFFTLLDIDEKDTYQLHEEHKEVDFEDPEDFLDLSDYDLDEDETE